MSYPNDERIRELWKRMKSYINNRIGNLEQGIQMELLWENASPTSNFDPQNVSVDLSEYNMFYVMARYGATGSMAENEFGMLIEKNKPSLIFIVSAANYAGYRFIKITDTRIEFGSTSYSNTANQNSYAIPIRIYGIKEVN